MSSVKSSGSAMGEDDGTASGVSTIPGLEGEIVPLPVASVVSVVTVGDRTVQIVEVVEPRVDVPEGRVQAGPAAVLVTQADIQPASCSGVGKLRAKINGNCPNW